jgi:hypothetical protein
MSCIFFLMGEPSVESLFRRPLHDTFPRRGVQAAHFDTSLLNASRGWTKLDILARAMQQK